MKAERRFVNLEAAQRAHQEISFSFGSNWLKFLRALNDERIRNAERSLKESFRHASFAGQSFVDVGCGSGLFSLSATQLGASPVVSLDVDPGSIACATELKLRSGNPDDWRILGGSILDPAFVVRLPQFQRVYSWGVLHHTGAMWNAIDNVIRLVAPGGLLCLALYNRPNRPEFHMRLKQLYNVAPRVGKLALRGAYGVALLGAVFVLRRRNPFTYVGRYQQTARGMSFWRDVEDWLGGLPCEFASKEEVIAFVEQRGLTTEHVLVRPPGANNEYLFRRVP